MTWLNDWNWYLDGWIVAAGILCAVAASLVGNFLVLRKMSMLGDAISHAVLPGLAAAFFLTGQRNSLPMFLGAAAVGVLTAFLTEWIRRIGRVDENGAMGVVFTALFALGLIMIVQAADRVDLDPGCVLYGAIELTPLDRVTLGGFRVPRVVVVLSGVLALNLAAVLLLYKELKLSSFDPDLATTLGINATAIHYLLMTLVAVTAVASFESVGNILVVAMFVVPAATAHLCTDRLSTMIVVSALVAALAAALGHVGAVVVPQFIGYRSTNTAGMMAVAAGLLFGGALLFAPRYGLVVKFARRRLLTLQIQCEDVLAQLYRDEEPARTPPRADVDLPHPAGPAWPASLPARRAALAWLRFRGEIEAVAQHYALTERGRHRAHALVRAHRLWEQYLVTAGGLDESRLHPSAERLEHFTNDELRRRLADETSSPRVDPHGAPIPPELRR